MRLRPVLPVDDRRDPSALSRLLRLGGVAVALVGIVGFAVVRFGWFPTLDTQAGADDYAEFELASYIQLGLAVLVGVGGLGCVAAAVERTESGYSASPPMRDVGAFFVVASLILVWIALANGFAGAWDA